MAHHLFELLARHGPPVLFLGQMFGILGVPVPDELMLMIAGALVRRGDLRGPTTVMAAIAGSLTGITLSYALGRFVGASVLRRLYAIDTNSVNRAQSWFARFGKWLLVLGYAVPGVRHLTAIVAGSARLDFRVFATYAYSGAALWSTSFVAFGYYAGDRSERAALSLRGHLIIVSIAVAALAAVYAFLRRRERA